MSRGKASFGRLASAALVLGVLPFSASGVANADSYLVPIKSGGFGPFKVSAKAPPTAAELRAVFGASSAASPKTKNICVLRWRPLGIRATVVVLEPGQDPCEEGFYFGATLTGGQWHTATGLRVGSSEKRVRRYAARTCSSRRNCGAIGYALGLRRTDCAAGKFPTVVAVIRRARLAAFVVYPPYCE